MRQVGVYDAKTKFASLIEDVEHGQTIVITRHGRPVARLLPMEGERPDVKATIAAIRRERAGTTLGGTTIRELIEEGRRH